MFSDSKISNYQFFTILTGFLIGSTAILNPSAGAKQDAWLAFLFALIGGILLISMYVTIARLNPSKTLIEILRICFGNVIGTIISILYIWYFIHLAALVLRNFGEYFTVVNYPETPICFIIFCFIVVIVYAVRRGIEVIGRISEIFILLLVINVVFVFFTLISIFDVENFKPFLASGMGPIIKTAFSILTFPFGEAVIFLMILPHVNNQKKMYKTSIMVCLLIGILFITVISRNIMVLGADMASRDVFPSHIVYRLIPGLDLDPIVDVNFIMAGIVKISICMYAGITGISRLFGLRNYKTFVIPVASFVLPLSIWVYGSIMEMMEWAIDIWPIYSIPFQFVIPFILLVISFFRNKQAENKKDS